MKRLSVALLQVSMFLAFSGCSRVDSKLEEQADGLLLQRYETVVSVRSKFLSRLRPDLNKEMGPASLGLPFVYLRAALASVGPNAFGVLEGGSDTVLTGAKDFVAPQTPGIVMARTTTIAILAPSTARTLRTEFSKIKVAVMDGRPVWTWTIDPYKGFKTDDPFYAAIVANSFFVLSTDAEDFNEVANALEKGAVVSAFPSGPDWTSLRTYAYWAYRTIGRSEPGADHWASGQSALPGSAVGLELFTDFDDGKAFLSILGPEGPSGSTPVGLPSPETLRFQRAGAGRWQAAISLSNSHETTAALVQALYYFGYGLAL